MIWLTWRQFRAQAIAAVAALAAFAILLAATGPRLASLYAASGLSGCHPASCADQASSWLTQLYIGQTYPMLYLFSIAVILIAPAVLGLFWGAPLIASELETGTAALAWNQSVTRTQWLAAKLTVGGLAAMAVTEGLSLMQAWWAAPIGHAVGLGATSTFFASSRFNSLTFASHGITPLGYAAFGYALGVTAGALIRRAVPAMAVTLAIFAVTQIAMPLWIRPSLLPAEHTVVSVTSLRTLTLQGGGPRSTRFYLGTENLPGQPGAWILSAGTITATGQAITTTPAACTMQAQDTTHGFIDCLAGKGIQESVGYQPASRYWPFQWIETAIYLALAVALSCYCFWRLSRRLT
ncbi:MAG TPA: ABC transporter permease [Trebonia sp.]|nr:ABC transporter permease [Trebonia sp.]